MAIFAQPAAIPPHRLWMSPKKKALALTAAPQPNPKRQKGGTAKSSPEQDPAPFSDSPTVKQLRADYALLRPYLQASEPPLPWSGIGAYEDNECKSQLQSSGRYECTLGVNWVQRTVDLWKADMTVEEDGQVVLTWPAVIALQAQEGCRPTPGDVKLLSNENVFLSRLVCNDSPVIRFLHLWAEAVRNAEHNLIAACRVAARRMRVSFLLMKSAEDAEKAKWRLESSTHGVASTQTLRGWKRICGYVEVRNRLAAQHVDSSPDKVSCWLHAAGVDVKQKTLSGLFRAYDRLQAAKGCLVLLEEMDSRFGQDHFYSNSGVLTMLCERTACPRNPTLQADLLLWAVSCLAYRCTQPADGRVAALSPTTSRATRQQLDLTWVCVFFSPSKQRCFIPNCFGKEALTKQVGVELAQRRVIQYLSGKMQRRGSGSKVVLANYFVNFQDWQSRSPAQRAQILKQLDPSEIAVYSFMEQMLLGNIAIHQIVSQAVAEHYLVPAEVLLQKPAWKEDSILDLDVLCADPEPAEVLLAAAEAATPQPVQPEESRQGEPDPAQEEDLPEMPDAASAEQPLAPTRGSFFETLAVPSWLEDLLCKASLAAFEAAYHHAKMCAGLSELAHVTGCGQTSAESNIDLRVVHDLPTQVRETLKETEDACFFLIDPKCSYNPHGLARVCCGEQHIYRQVTSALSDAVRAKDGFALWDARSVKTSKYLQTFIKAGVTEKHWRQRGVCTVRLLHHNREWDPECRDSRDCVRQRKARAGKSVNTSTSPDPLESLLLVGSAEFWDSLPRRERKYVDLPGHSGSLGWTRLSLRSASDRDANCILPLTKSLIWTGAPGLSEAYADEAPDGDEIVQAVPDEASPVSLCEWESPEELYAEVMHCYMPDKSRLVDILPGSGMKAVAAARMGKSYVGFVRSALHAALIRETGDIEETPHEAAQAEAGDNEGAGEAPSSPESDP
ncbi:unnamed protein product [Effrenium voratum]|uniref:Uncharacterized protein n=1 Tax=Effrenium voratum TaxID=2562239 RepID=A0AA36MSK9_9DINO|nr:unnamed protein product [Effrenium voratum]